jgi:D-psicose/D-tagatose/L-ribulose 3-epimerase
MKYGMNLLLWTGDLTEEHLPVLESLKKMGYDGVEIPMFGPDPDKFARLGKRLDDLGLERSAVTVRNAADNPISPDAKIRAAGVDANKRILDSCQAAGAHTLVGPYHSAIGEFTGVGRTGDEWKWGIESMREVAEHAAKCGVTLGVEYLNRFECYFLNTAADAVRFVEGVNHPHCKTMYDTFHANIEEKDPIGAIRTLAPHTALIHVSENDRSTPGQGNIPWAETFKTIKDTGYDGWLVIEAFGLSLPELAAATKIWRKMYDSEEQLAREGLAFMKKHTQ